MFLQRPTWQTVMMSCALEMAALASCRLCREPSDMYSLASESSALPTCRVAGGERVRVNVCERMKE